MLSESLKKDPVLAKPCKKSWAAISRLKTPANYIGSVAGLCLSQYWIIWIMIFGFSSVTQRILGSDPLLAPKIDRSSTLVTDNIWASEFSFLVRLREVGLGLILASFEYSTCLLARICLVEHTSQTII